MQVIIEKIIQETSAVKRFLLRAVGVHAPAFLPGQFIAVSIKDGEGEWVERSYSIANAPEDSGFIELCIVLNPEGKVTPVLWQKKEGDFLEISEPKGSMLLPEIWDKDLCFICTGTGVAPFRSMIGALMSKGRFEHDVFLIFGNRYRGDILYKSEFEEWTKIEPRFHFIPVLSREEWNGEKGYVHGIYEQIFSDNRNAHFYVCGWNAMCREARQRLKAMGYNRRQYTFEQYDG